ncbi:MAG TPA: DUF433 domain-containing protein [Verrucomicrobiota bacterium]|nr:DUF433 domain-containing protein [Verrucomicrobiota bacterium]HRZ35909.1 DUF433 domain-containing protein [Candidatus Paceibacterota bacterium]HRZ56944.1 DUF433 domain-containing protein [Candidatus Paceibacterota bacterium]
MTTPSAGWHSQGTLGRRSDVALLTAGVDSATFPAMPVELTYPHIVRTPGEPARLERHPRTRVSMIVADYLWRGWSAEEIVRQYPYLTLAEVHAALASYFDQPDDIDAELAAEYQDVERWGEAHPTPALLARLKAQKAI